MCGQVLFLWREYGFFDDKAVDHRIHHSVSSVSDRAAHDPDRAKVVPGPDLSVQSPGVQAEPGQVPEQPRVQALHLHQRACLAGHRGLESVPCRAHSPVRSHL